MKAAGSGRRWTRPAVAAGIGVLGADLLTVLVTGASFTSEPVGRAGFLMRLALGAILLLAWSADRDRRPRAAVVLVVVMLPCLYSFQFAGGRINGDGFFYYAYVRSWWKDGDANFENEYRHYGLLERAELARPTVTGHRRNVFSAGPAVLWSPFFLLGELFARGQALVSGDADVSGYGPPHRNAVALGSLLYGAASVLLIHSLLRRYFPPLPALVAAALVAWATPLPWYMVQQPTMSHAPATFAAALVVWTWDRHRGRPGVIDGAALGLAIGLAACVRWPNAVLILLPIADALRHRREAPTAWLRLAAVAAGALAGFLPQMLAWRAMFGEYLLSAPPQGAGFMRLNRPFVLETLFSSRHGLLAWTPVLWLGYLGLVPLVWRRRGPFVAMAACLLVLTYVNMCSGDWWAGGSFSNRRFDSCLPLLSFGLATSYQALENGIRRAPALAAAVVLAAFALWNVLLMEQVRRGLAPQDGTISFTTLTANNARILYDAVGAPFAWPANWLFAWRQGRPFAQYDLLVGRYLFYRTGNLGGVIEVGEDDGGLLGHGWRAPAEAYGARVRAVGSDSARVFVPLDEPEDLEVRLRAAAPGGPRPVGLAVNGMPVASFSVGPDLGEHAVVVPAARWRRDLNTIDLKVPTWAGAGEVLVDRFVLRPGGGR